MTYKNTFLSNFENSKNIPSKIPFWFMRQAGRYLPEYKKIRGNFSNFLEFCYNPEAACEVTIQPISRYGMSAAIIFSDILVIPDALGMDVRFVEGQGPVLTPLKNISELSYENFSKILEPVYQAINMVRKELNKETSLIGFCGLPWTLSCYMLNGKSSRDFQEVRQIALQKKEFFTNLTDLLISAISEHSLKQIEAGAEVIQLFDSWAGVLSEREFYDYSIIPTKKITKKIKEKYPNIPVIGFPRLAGSKIIDYAKETGVDAVSFDGSISLDIAHEELADYVVAQGNLDPVTLACDKEQAIRQTKKIIEKMSDKRFIFNLSHGILPHTPVDNVAAICDVIKSYDRK
ncbi:MAG: uroporphyrinogen decarboxylase [Rickettsiales bacterium]